MKDPIEILTNASKHACFHDNAKSSRDAEYILWVSKRIVEHTRAGDERAANHLHLIRSEFLRTFHRIAK